MVTREPLQLVFNVAAYQKQKALACLPCVSDGGFWVAASRIETGTGCVFA